MAGTVYTQKGSSKSLAQEQGYLVFTTTNTTMEVPTSLYIITNAIFTPVPGTSGLTYNEQIHLAEAALGTSASVGGTCDYPGAVLVSGTAVTVNRVVAADGTNTGTAQSALGVRYIFFGVNR